jgi:hypothetical protein
MDLIEQAACHILTGDGKVHEALPLLPPDPRHERADVPWVGLGILAV